MKTSIAVVFFAICSSLAAQNSPPAVAFRGNCANKLPTYHEWFQQTRLPYSEPYLAPGKRKQRILEHYSKLKLQMSLEEVENLLGKADFSTPRPTARLGTAPEPKEQQCSNQIAYVVKKSSENMADMEDVAIYLFFSEDSKLYWATPQNLPSLKPLGSPTEGFGLVFAQHKTVWKEYLFADDGFAITLPDEPNPHTDPTLPEMTVYTPSLLSNAKLTLRVSHQNRDCAATLAQLKDGALQGKEGIDPSSVKDVSIDGHAGLEYQYSSNAYLVSSDRFYCVNGRFYAFSTNWPSTPPRPEGVDRVIKSFRLLNPESPR